MDQKTDNKIKTILLTVQILKPATIRLILNENAGQMENEELKTWFRGHNSTSLQEADVQFYQIMKNQSRIVIPSINQSRLLAGLGMEDSGAIICRFERISVTAVVFGDVSPKLLSMIP